MHERVEQMALTYDHNMESIEAMIIRGGSSKGVYLNVDDLPPAGLGRDEVVLKVFGSPDLRQIDGLGGADKLTSKVAVMGLPTRSDCDIDYLFGQVNIALPRIDWKSNCGNISSGAALYAALKGMGRTRDGLAEINIHQVNTGRLLRCFVPMRDGSPETEGEFSIGGVPGSGARIDIDFFDFAGSALGGDILPTGRPVDRFNIPGVGIMDVSVVDMANLHIFVRASDIGLDPTRSIYELQEDRELVARLEAVRKVVAGELNFITGETADEELKVSMNPLIFAVAPPTAYLATNDKAVSVEDQDLTSRSLARFAFSKAYPGSGSAGTAVACGIEGTLAQEAFRGSKNGEGPYGVRIGHPGGVLEVIAETSCMDGKISIQRAQLGRTARLIMAGKCYTRLCHK
jgi:2-methylaconitate cis-trans-isomerase PrpF